MSKNISQVSIYLKLYFTLLKVNIVLLLKFWRIEIGEKIKK